MTSTTRFWLQTGDSFLCTVQEQDLPPGVRVVLDFETSYLDLILSRCCIDVFGDPCIASSGLLGVCGDPLVPPLARDADDPLLLTQQDADRPDFGAKV